MGANFYPNDKHLREWIGLYFVVTDSTWKHIDEYKSNVTGMAVPEVIRRHEAMTRGLQAASFTVHDLLKEEEIDVDDLLAAVSTFYLAALEVARYLEEEVKGGEIQPKALRDTAENLLRISSEWTDLMSKGFKLARGKEDA